MNYDRTILIVDDEVELLELTSKILQKAGYRTIEVSRAEPAIEIFREKHNEIGIVLLDLLLPDMNGVAVHDEMYKLNPQVHTIFLSGDPYQIEGDYKNLPAGVLGILEKPFEVTELLGMLNNVFAE